MTYPDGRPILTVMQRKGVSQRGPVLINEQYLRGFGEMRVPSAVWRALQRYSVWIEPALVEEWMRLMKLYAGSQGRELERDRAAAAMTWSSPERDVQIARPQADRLLETRRIHCVWSGRALSPASLDIDHCLPWSAWPCSDLWNLMPASRPVNQHEKREKLPSVRLMRASQDRIMTWWEAAYRTAAPVVRERFDHEASTTLPCPDSAGLDLDDLFEGVLSQRSRLQFNQRVPEWAADKCL